jgi:hypothetical protein
MTESDVEASGDEVANTCFAMNAPTLAAVCDALLPKLMSGEIRVSTNNN